MGETTKETNAILNMSCIFCKTEKDRNNTTIWECFISYCPECSNYEIIRCIHENNKVVRYMQSGRWYVKNLCTDCNTLNGSFLKQSDYDFENLKTINKEKYDTFKNIESKNINDFLTPLRDKWYKWEKDNWFKEYGDYLNSNEWKDKRLKVLERDNYLCQSCRINKATEVHHLTYNHKGHEPLFDLVSVCKDCHELITMLDRKII